MGSRYREKNVRRDPKNGSNQGDVRVIDVRVIDVRVIEVRVMESLLYKNGWF